MDAEAREKFRHQLRTDPPEVSVENCPATVESLILDSRNIFLRGIANVFSRLDRRFRTHDAFAIGRSEEHTSELQSLMRISYAVFCLKKKKNNKNTANIATYSHIAPLDKYH